MLWTRRSEMLHMLIRQSHPEARQKRPRKFYAMIVKVFTLARVAKLADARALKSVLCGCSKTQEKARTCNLKSLRVGL
jgi:hypothetical protein